LCEAIFRQRCRSCGSEMECRAYEASIQGRLPWVIWCRCESCGDGGEEEFGWDETPSEVRQALLDQCGVFRLRVQPGEDLSRVRLMRVLRTEGAAVAEVSSRVDVLLSTGMSGTEVEMELMKDKLKAVGVEATVAREEST